jgi:serralysin
MRLSTVLAVLVVAPAIPASAQHVLGGPACPEAAPFFSFCDWELRPDTAEWIPLLAPAGNNITGTRGADALAAVGEGDVVSGLAGNDALSSSFNRTALLGGDGGDDLSSDVVAAAGEGIVGIGVALGGRGNDVLRASLTGTGFDGENELLIDLGAGDDRVEASGFLDPLPDLDDGDQTVTNQVFAQSGDDTITSVADAEDFFGNALALNAVDGGMGHDHITVRAVTEFDGGGTIADNRVSAGDGDDVVDATAINPANEPVLASNLLLGGRGDDVMRAVMWTDSNSTDSVGSNELQGGDGDDELHASHGTDGEPFLTDLTTLLDGGKGDDRLSAESQAWGENVLTSHELTGGPGDDSLTLALDLAIFDGDGDAQNVLDGGSGTDHLEATVTRTCEEEDLDCDLVAHAENHLEGGSGNDALFAAIAPDVIGASILRGGNGNDELTVSGGTGNELDGGKGEDLLFAGEGDDRMSGGKDRDKIYFDLAVDQGSDTLADFDARRDALRFAGIDDLGNPGLTDDLDAISSFDDQGSANDVVIDLASGSQIIFAGSGTGDVDSWADLLPARALGQWQQVETRPARRPAAALASRAAAVPEFTLLRRDH